MNIYLSEGDIELLESYKAELINIEGELSNHDHKENCDCSDWIEEANRLKEEIDKLENMEAFDDSRCPLQPIN